MYTLAWQTLVDGDRCQMDAPRPAPSDFLRETRLEFSDQEALLRRRRDALR